VLSARTADDSLNVNGQRRPHGQGQARYRHHAGKWQPLLRCGRKRGFHHSTSPREHDRQTFDAIGDTDKSSSYVTPEKFRLRKRCKIAAWNVRSMNQPGKLFLIERELMRLQLKVVGLSEVRWTKQGHFITNNGNTLVYAGHDTQHTAGVAVWLDKSV